MDQENLREIYISGDKSLGALAEEAGIPQWMLKKQAAKEGWAAEKRLFQKAKKAGLEEKQAMDGEEKLRPLRQASEGLCAHLAAMTEDGTLKELNPQGLHQLAGALKDMVTVVRNLHDLPALKERKEKPEPIQVEFSGRVERIVENMKKENEG